MARIAIVGGGIAGLATAYELTRRGQTDFVLYEASGRLGGIVETVRQEGFVIECGPDSWVTEKPWARELAIELGLEAAIIPSQDAHRRTYLAEGGTLTPMPDGMRMMVPTDLDAIDGSPLFTEAARRAYRGEPLRAPEFKAFAASRSADEDESVSAFVERHFGPEVTEKIAAPLLAGVFGGEIRKLSVAAVMAPFLKLEREYGSLILGLQQQQRIAEPRPVFTTLKGGLQSLVDAIAAVIPRSAVHLGEAVLAIHPKRGGWEISSTRGSATFDHIVLATPVHIARELIAPFHRELSSLLDIRATSSVVAALAFDQQASKSLSIPKGFGFLVPQHSLTSDAEPQLLACTFVDQKFAHRVPEGCVLLRAFYGGESAPPLLTQSDEAILALASRQLSRLVGELPQPKIALIRRWPLSLPQYTVGHRARVAGIEAIAGSLPGFHLIGNAFHGVGLPDLIRQGRSTAALLS
jgi:oxygen-dependent protoporphyrinogen oxidase